VRESIRSSTRRRAVDVIWIDLHFTIQLNRRIVERFAATKRHHDTLDRSRLRLLRREQVGSKEKQCKSENFHGLLI